MESNRLQENENCRQDVIQSDEEMRKKLISYCSGRSCSNCLVPAAVPNHRCGRGVGIMTLKPDGGYDISDSEIRAAFRAVFQKDTDNKPLPVNTSKSITPQTASLKSEEMRKMLISYCAGRSCSECLVPAAVPDHHCGRGVGIMTRKPEGHYDINDDEILSIYQAVFNSQTPETNSQQMLSKKREINHTLTNCFKCGKIITSATCRYCRYNNAALSIKLLCRVEPRKLQIVK